MTLGIALLLIFILYLIDKHDRWRQLVKIIIWLAIIGVVGLGGFFGWAKYEDYKTNKANEAYRIKMQPFWDCTSRNAQFSNAEEECKKDPSIVLQPVPPRFSPIQGPSEKYKAKPRLHHVGATYDTDLTTTEYGSLTCGHVVKGGTVTLLAEDNAAVKVKTTAGKVGWAMSGAFEIVD
jgi:hypothetical protein